MSENKDIIESAASKKSHKKLKYGTLSTAFIAIFIVIVIMLNIVASLLNDKYSLNIDLTSNKYYELSDESINYVKTLDKDVNITVLYPEDAFEAGSVFGNYSGDAVIDKQIIELLKEYASYSDKISIEFIDMVSNPAKVSKLNENYSGELSEGDIVVECESRVKVFNVYDLLLLDEEGYNEAYMYYMYGYAASFDPTEFILGYDTENTLTSAIAFVSNANPVKVAVVGSEEEGTLADYFVKSLDLNGYYYQYIDLLKDEIPEDVSVLIIPGPQNDYTNEMLDKVDDYLFNDGIYGTDIIYIAPPVRYDTPNLDSFLANWGFEFYDGIVFEQDEDCFVTSDNVQYVFAQTVDNTESESLNENYNVGIHDESLPIYAINILPMKRIFDRNSSIYTASLLTTSNDAVIVDMDGNIDKKSETIYEIAALASRRQYINNELCINNVLAISSAYLVNIDDPSLNNYNWLIGAVNTITEKEESIKFEISSTQVENYDIAMKEKQSKVVTALVIFIIPISVLLVCGIVWFRRRHR